MRLDIQATAQIAQAWRQAIDELGGNGQLVCPVYVGAEAVVSKAARVILVIGGDNAQLGAVDGTAGSRHALKASAEVSLSQFAYFGGFGSVERVDFAQADFHV